ncbi:MAG: response regulator, partial [Burkholderiales bacterium]
RDHAHAIAQDMTRELRQTTLVQRAILDSANYSIVSTDERGIIRTFNRAAERMLGYTAVEVVGKATLAVIHDPQEIAQRAKALTAELGRVIEPGFEVFVAKTRSGTPDETEWTCVRKDGLRFPLLLSVTALHDGQDNLTGFLAIGYDMTERKAMERLKNEFISTVSHELRTPLTSIMGSLGLLTSGIGGSLPDQASSLIEIARKNAARLVRLINDILDIDKIESGKMRFDLREHELMPLVSQAIEANRDYARQFGVDFVIERALPLARVKVDSDRLAQVFTNLLSNAAKFSPRGTKVAIAVERTDGCIRISVTDSGAGIPPEFESKIFQKFCQADSSDTRQKDGSGLGLSITKAIVEHSGGRIGFRSRPGAGTTFIVDLPEVSPSVAAPVAAAPHQHTDRPRVLICEDDHDIARLLQLMLEGAGYVADISHDAERAKRMLAQNAYAALTLDIALPGQDGIGLIRELRATATTRDLPIVVVSAHAERGRQTLQGSGIVIIDWLDKPIDQQRLLAAFGRTLKRGTLRPRILHVEDDPDISQIVATLVSPHYEMECAPTLAAARNALQRDHYDLVILDMELPDGSGSELLPLVHTLSKPTPVLVFSANETPCNLPDMIAASLVKSQTTNDRLLQTILHILPPAAAENESLFAATA